MNSKRLLEQYAQIARPLILKDFTPDSCIASTRITIDVFRSFGIRAVEFPCAVIILNRYLMERIAREGRVPRGEEIVEWTSDGKAWSVGIGLPKCPGDLPTGHLAAIVDDNYLVDASLDQAARPDKFLNLPPVFVQQVNRAFRRSQAPAVFDRQDGIYLKYVPCPKHTRYQSSSNWDSNHPAVRSVVSRILSKLGDTIDLERHHA